MRIPNPSIIRGRFARPIVYCVVTAALLLVFYNPVFSALFDNGFDLEDPLVPADQIRHGGPPKDGIPAIDAPKFIAAAEATFLAPDDRVMGLVRGGQARAYPVAILNYHEIVNDVVADEPVVVSYCPLCGTGMAFTATIDGEPRSFGVSGLLYNSDVLLYDRESESLWSQIMKTAVTGPMKGEKLNQIAVSHTAWRDWQSRHPDTLVLSPDTGYSRDYSRSPYQGYETSSRVWFPVANTSEQYHPKELVIGVDLDGRQKAYPFVELTKGPSIVQDQLGDRSFQVEFDAANRSGRILTAEGEEIPTTIAFWFAWYAFFPDTEVYTAN